MIQGIPLEHFLIVSTIMFFIGVCGFIIRRNLITMLMATELILNRLTSISWFSTATYIPINCRDNSFHCSLLVLQLPKHRLPLL